MATDRGSNAAGSPLNDKMPICPQASNVDSAMNLIHAGRDLEVTITRCTALA